MSVHLMVVTNPLAVPTIMCLQVYRRVFGTHCLPVIVLDYWGLAVCIGGGNDFMVHCLLLLIPHSSRRGAELQ